jgi:hypothetical protein
MQRLRHIVFSWLASLSFLLFLLACALWPASHYRRLLVQSSLSSGDLRHNSDSTLHVDLYPGLVATWLESSLKPAQRYDVDRRLESGIEGRSMNMSAEWDSFTYEPNPIDHQFWGFGYGFASGGGSDDQIIEGPVFGSIGAIKSFWVECRLPLWFIILLTSTLPGLYVRRAVRSYRQRKYGLCANCNYDLRASRDICPECGAKRSNHVPHKRHLFTELSLVASTTTLMLAALMWAVSSSRAF